MSKSRLTATGDDIDGDSEKQVKIWHNAINPKSARVQKKNCEITFHKKKQTKKSVQNKDNLRLASDDLKLYLFSILHQCDFLTL